MLRKSLVCSTLLAASLCLCGCEFLRNHTAKDIFSGNIKSSDALTQTASQTYTESTATSATNNITQPQKSSSIVVCRSQQCAPAKLSMSREYVYNSLLQLFDNNNYQNLLVCQADPQTRTCLENYITLPTKVGVVPTNSYIDHAKITDVVVGKQNNSIRIILNYNLTYGGQVAECTPSQSLLFVRSVDHTILEDSGYNCKMTTMGLSNVKTIFAIDYIDLDYGYIGGHYSIGISGPAFGGGNGYMILRLPKNAYPLSPALTAPKAKSQKTKAYSTGGSSTTSSDETANSSGSVQIFPIEKKSEE